ncbi:hypothetical protein ACJ41O_013020 [Fusarium nematophilum]
MATVARSGTIPSPIAHQGLQMPPAQSPIGTEWELLRALRSHHGRLDRKTHYQPLDRSLKRVGSVEWRNATAFFDTGLRQILTKGDLDTLVEHKLEQQRELAQSHLKALCAILDQLVNIALLSEGSEIAEDQDKSDPYPNLSPLVRLLEETDWDFELATGRGNILFTLTSEQDATEARNVVRHFNDFFSHTLQMPTRTEQPTQTATTPWRLRNALRDQAVKGLESLFLRVPRGRSEACQGHHVLVKLPDWESIGPQEMEATEPRAALDLFLSTCSDSAKWHAACCDVQSSISSDDYDTCSFCEDFMDARVTGSVFRFTASNGKLFMPFMDAERWPIHPDRQPTASLHDLIENYSFVEPQSFNPLMPLRKAQRFHRKQKRALAARLALCLSLYLDSEYTLTSCDSRDVFFLSEKGQCKQNLIYVTSVVNTNHGDTQFDSSIAIYIALARLLLEIEYGVSLEKQDLGKVRKWVDDMLLLNQEELDPEYYDDMIDIRNIEARKIYLTAVRDLLNFKQTYRRGSRRLKGRIFDIGAIAREIIFTEIAEKIRSSIEPTRLRTSGLAGLKEELYRQRPIAIEAIRVTTIQLFDENDEISQDADKAGKADFFFNLLQEFQNSCEERAASIHGTESGPHTRVRIAVLDTGIDKTNGAISGGIIMRRITDENCYSWVGNNTNDIHDIHGHGTKITELLLRVAPEADIYICKVFNGTELCTDEAKNVAKAITHAVDVWNVDIITMSFGLNPPTPDDQGLKAAYQEIEAAIDKARHKIFFAAAANHGGHGPRTFPASNPNVICIHASDGKGKDGGISPTPESTDDNFMTLGIAVKFGAVRCSGTSYAAPMAAAMAANVLYAAESLLKLSDTANSRLRTGQGMRKMFSLMCGPRCPNGYRFVAPWVRLWTENWHRDDDRIRMIESTILTTDLFRY